MIKFPKGYDLTSACHFNKRQNYFSVTYLGVSMSGTCKKLLLLGFWGEWRVGTARAKSSATGTCGEPNPVEIPYRSSWNTLQAIQNSINTHNTDRHFYYGPYKRIVVIKWYNQDFKYTDWSILSSLWKVRQIRLRFLEKSHISTKIPCLNMRRLSSDLVLKNQE